MMVKTLKLLFTGTVLAGAAALAQSDPETVRRDFRQAYAIAAAGGEAAETSALRRYVLYPYLQAARLRSALERDAAGSDAAVETFLQTYAAQPVARELRRAWLMSLAQRAQWTQFLAHYAADAADLELRCQALQARLSLQQLQELQGAIAALWMTAARLPSDCTVPMTWARVQNVITAEMIEQRVALALKAGNTALARELLPIHGARADALSQWLQLIEQPRAAIDRLLANPDSAVDDTALLDGWTRLVRKDPDAALARYARLVSARRLDQAVASPYALALALALSWSRRAEALEYFERANVADFNDLAWEWYVRAALWAGDWRRVSKAIAAMPSALQAQARWRYWSARAAEQLHDRARAKAGYTQLMDTEDNYYAALAAARLDEKYTPHVQALALDPAHLAALETRPGLQRARELFYVELKPQAGVEWNAEYKQLSPEEQAAAVHLASRWGWHDVAIAVAAQQRVFNDYRLLYPRPYDKEVKAAAKLTKLSEELIYGQLRQESLFKPDAVSSANARGLLQLVPDTARSTAKRWKWAAPSIEQLFDPAINVKLGAAHLRELIEKYDQVVVALAAYNAGPRAAERWLPSHSMDADVWIENIPYNETRNYIQKILWHSLVFHWLEKGRPVETHTWLTKVRS